MKLQFTEVDNLQQLLKVIGIDQYDIVNSLVLEKYLLIVTNSRYV